MTNYIKQFWLMPSSHKKIVVKAWYLFIFWNLLISYVPYRFWKNKLFKTRHTFSDASAGQVSIICNLIEKVARRHFVKINCLRRCTVQKYLLSTMGFQTQLVFGVKKHDSSLEAHCWLTYNKQIINDSIAETSKYTPLVSTDKHQQQMLKNLK